MSCVAHHNNVCNHLSQNSTLSLSQILALHWMVPTACLLARLPCNFNVCHSHCQQWTQAPITTAWSWISNNLWCSTLSIHVLHPEWLNTVHENSSQNIEELWCKQPPIPSTWVYPEGNTDIGYSHFLPSSETGLSLRWVSETLEVLFSTHNACFLHLYISIPSVKFVGICSAATAQGACCSLGPQGIIGIWAVHRSI